jgi:hypothetical protein
MATRTQPLDTTLTGTGATDWVRGLFMSIDIKAGGSTVDIETELPGGAVLDSATGITGDYQNTFGPVPAAKSIRVNCTAYVDDIRVVIVPGP